MSPLSVGHRHRSRSRFDVPPSISPSERADRRGPDWYALLDPVIERSSDTPLFRQVYLQLRQAVLDRVLPPGSRLPSTRALAGRLGLSRTSVMLAYEQLLAEGYTRGRIGAGTYVADDLPPSPEVSPAESEDLRAVPHRRPLSASGERYRSFSWDHVAFDDAPFNTGRCTIDSRTLAVWRKLTARRLAGIGSLQPGYADPLGAPELRAALAGYLRVARAVCCEPDQIIVVSGAQHAVDLTLRILVDPGDAVWVEDPCYPAVHGALVAIGARIVPVPVDRQGIVVDAGTAAAPDAKLAYVTPSHQFPLGVIQSMSRRLELLSWARRSGAWIIEDDYDSEFRYAGKPLAALQGIDGTDRVIYVGSLNKVLFPGLRIGYAVLPRELVPAFTAARFLGDRSPPSLAQGVVADFIEQGFFTSHIRRMRLGYREARDALAAALIERVADIALVEAPEQGMQLVIRLADGLDDRAIAADAARHGIIVRPLSPMFIDVPPTSGLMLGFSGFSPDRLRRAVATLAPVLQQAANDLT